MAAKVAALSVGESQEVLHRVSTSAQVLFVRFVVAFLCDCAGIFAGGVGMVGETGALLFREWDKGHGTSDRIARCVAGFGGGVGKVEP